MRVPFPASMGGPGYEQTPDRGRELAVLAAGSTGRPELELRLRTADGGVRHILFNAVFVPDERLHTRDRFEGTGIGLAIARNVVERHGEEISAAPRAEGGSRFTFTLPQGGA